jgi:RNA polymerase sigma-70 factor, ECF subfamily
MNDLQLVEELANGSPGAVELLYDRYGALAYSVSVRVLGDPGKAEDVVQDVFLKVWNSASLFAPARGSLRAWLLMAVRNRSIDYLRGRGARERQATEIPDHLEALGQGSDPWREVAESIERQAIRQAVDSLPLEQKQAVELAFYAGYTQREIAEMTRVPLSTVKGRMRLALEKLHTYLQGEVL